MATIDPVRIGPITRNNGNETVPAPTAKKSNGNGRTTSIKPTFVRDPHAMDLPWKRISSVSRL